MLKIFYKICYQWRGLNGGIVVAVGHKLEIHIQHWSHGVDKLKTSSLGCIVPCALLLQHSTKTADLLWWMTNDRGQLNCLVVACLQSPVSAGTWFISSWNSARRPPIELSTGFRGISLRQEKVPIAYRAFSFFKTTTSFNDKASICLLMHYAL